MQTNSQFMNNTPSENAQTQFDASELSILEDDAEILDDDDIDALESNTFNDLEMVDIDDEVRELDADEIPDDLAMVSNRDANDKNSELEEEVHLEEVNSQNNNIDPISEFNQEQTINLEENAEQVTEPSAPKPARLVEEKPVEAFEIVNDQMDEKDTDVASDTVSPGLDAVDEPEVIPDAKAIEQAQPNISKIGRLLFDLGKISRSDMKKILRTQKKHGLLFGDAALKLGLIDDADIQKVVAMQFNYHYLQAGQGEFSEDLVAAYAPFSKKVESYRALRSQLMMRWFKKGQRSLAVVSASRNEGVTYLTANLGVVFSQLGARTLVIESNMRNPKMHTIFNMKETAGLSDVLVGRLGMEAIQEIESIPDLSVLSAGTVPPNPQELLGRTSFNILLKTLEQNYDVILIDTPPAIESADAQSAIELAQGTLLVSRKNHTKQAEVLEVRNQIEMTGASVVAAVMNEY